MKYSDAKIIQFAKAPEAGKVKTRMIPELGAEGALSLHKKLIKRVWKTLNEAQLCQVELWVSGISVAPYFVELTSQTNKCAIQLQAGDDLGQRMANALQQVLAEYRYGVVVGSDCPAVTADYLDQAFAAMDEGADVVLGPAADGGYVLIGMRQLYSEVFAGIDWGSDRVLAQTRVKLKSLACSWVELPELWDVDRPEDLKKLAAL